MAEKLSARRVETLKPPFKGRLEIADSQVKGLSFRITASGERTWTLRGRSAGKEVRYFLGDYPSMGLAEARDAAAELRAQLRRGVDPRAEESARKSDEAAEKARKEAGSVSRLLALYWDLHLSEKANAKTWRTALENALRPHMHKPIEELTTLDLDTAVAAIRQAGKPVQANRVRSHLRTFTKWASDKGLSQRDVGKGMAKKTEELGRDRVLELWELAAIWNATLGPGGQAGGTGQRAPGQGLVWGPFIRFLMLTGQRFGDVSKMEWQHLSGNIWNQPASKTKNRKGHVVHLTEAALELIYSQASDSDERNGLVFHSPSEGKITSSNRRVCKLREESGIHDFNLHDFRTALASHLAGRGVSEGVVDRILNHAASVSRASAVARAYQRNDLLEQRKDALETWSTLVLEAVKVDRH